MSDLRIVVVGASAAGVSAVDALRRSGHGGPITLVDKDQAFPYDKPPLSKELLSGSWELKRAELRGERWFEEQGVTLMLGRTAVGLDGEGKRVLLDGGDELSYDKLLIATGVGARVIPGTENLKNVFTLRTLDDALKLSGELGRQPKLAIVGAGLIGSEVAATASLAGVKAITLIDPLNTTMEAVVGLEMGRKIEGLHEAHGVKRIWGAFVSEVLSEADRATSIILNTGARLDVDAVVVAIGGVPSTAWLETSALTLASGGVQVDQYCKAGPDVYAAGDVATWYSGRLDKLVRVEHRTNAAEQGIVAARNMLGGERTHDTVPYFWSDQYGLRIQGYGSSREHTRVSVDDSTPDAVLALYGKDDELVAAVGWGRAADIRAARDLLDKSASWEKALDAFGMSA